MNAKDQRLLEAFAEMDRRELLQFLEEEYGVKASEKGLDEMSKREILDYFVDHFRPDLAAYLHSDCSGGSYDSMHPNETEEDFFDHG